MYFLGERRGYWYREVGTGAGTLNTGNSFMNILVALSFMVIQFKNQLTNKIKCVHQKCRQGVDRKCVQTLVEESHTSG